jgi:uncharacterized protein (DUF58 family)
VSAVPERAGEREPLLDGATLRRLERLRLHELDAIVGGLLGDAAGSGSGGRGIEFGDYRPYAPGDDLRRIDWNVYARLRQPFLRTSPQDQELGLALLLDGSRSMGAHAAPAWRHAQRVAALLGAVALRRGGSVQATVLADGGAWSDEPLSGEQRVVALLDQLERLPRGRATDLAAGVAARRPLAVGVEVGALLTDALVELPELERALDALGTLRAATVLHVSEPLSELPADGPVELVDRESGERLALELTPAAIAAHAARLEQHAAAVAARCRARGIGYVAMVADGDALAQVTALAERRVLVEQAR